ncbi:RHS repeat-associated core domain-containing protein, partial [Brevibacillus borstelensis]
AKAEYTYYPDGLRATKTADGSETRYVYLNGRVIEELDKNGQLKAQNIWGNELLSRKDVAANKRGYYLYNSHGDVVKVVGENGEELNRYEYDTWGNLTAKTEGMSNPFTYSGEILDGETGFYYLRARYYDPTVGRFISEDTYKGQVDNPLTLNRYTYVHNNPLVNIDPTGNYCVSANGKNAHGGDCNSDSSIYLGEDRDFVGRPILDNGKIKGYIGVSGPGNGSADYWSTYKDDYSYVRWVSGDNDYYYSLESSTQQRLKYKLLSGYMKEQIEMGFPDFIAGLDFAKNVRSGSGIVLSFAKKGGNIGKQYKGTPRNNQAQNKQVRDIVTKYKLNKDQQRKLHDEISGQNYDFHTIEEIAKEIKAGRF